MKICVFSLLVVTYFSSMSLWAADEQEKWPKVSTGEYLGYAEIYAVKEGSYTIEGDTNLGGETGLIVTKKGVDCDGDFFTWDHPGLQASRDTNEGRERINFRGKIGNVVVADRVYENSKGKVVRVIRMSVAPAPVGNMNPRANQ